MLHTEAEILVSKHDISYNCETAKFLFFEKTISQFWLGAVYRINSV